MMKKVLFSFLTFSLVLSTFMLAPLSAADSKVCGIDGVTYDSEEAAEAAGVDVSYEFACVTVTDESKLYEAKSDVNFAGMLIEIGSTDIPTNIIVRDNADGHDYTISVTANTILGQRRDQATRLSDWIPGDQIRVIGKKNENTEDIEATILVNLSIAIVSNKGANGWITKIDKEAQEITYQWMNKEHTFRYDDNTRFVAGLKNPASVDDLKVNDRIRARLLLRQGEMPLAKIVVVLRRGKDLFMKIRTFVPRVTLVRLDSTIIPTTIQVRMDKTPGLRANDVNNLIGTEGALITVNITEDTKIVRKYFGRTTLDEFSVGDKLMIVGRVNDDGTVDAKVVKNNSIWKTSTRGHAGVVTAVDVANSFIMVNWTPIKHITRKKLKEKLKEADETVLAQLAAGTDADHRVSKAHLREALKARIKKVVAKKVGKFKRRVRHKKVKIKRIKHKGVKIKDLVKRLPVKKIRVDINDNTKIVVGTNNNATISDIQIGDKVRIRGTRHAKLPLVVADTIVVVNSLPEIEEPEDTEIDDVNEIVSEIVTDDPENSIVEDSVSDTEEEISEDDSGTTSGDSSEAVSEDSTDESNESSTVNNSTSNELSDVSGESLVNEESPSSEGVSNEGSADTGSANEDTASNESIVE
jgi:hypothetical protein